MVPRNLTNLIEGQKFKIYGEGLNVRDWLYVDDHCSAIEKVLLEGKIGETYCVGGDAPLSNIELAKIILKILGKDESWIEYVEDRKGHDRKYDINPSKLKAELGWKPSVDFAEGIEKTISWYKNNRDWWIKDKMAIESFYNKK
jgi:dTDP-glucose 4,6-dehydratase